MTSLPADRAVYRNVLLVMVRGGALLTVSFFLLLAVIIAAVLGPSFDTARWSVAGVGVGIVALLVLLAIRTVGSRITAGPDGVFVHTVFRTCQYLPWTNITGFELIPAPRLNNQFTRSAVAIAVIRPHEHKPLYCLGASFAQPSPAADAMLEALRASQRAAQAQTSPIGQL
jgi:hypothetical protein